MKRHFFFSASLIALMLAVIQAQSQQLTVQTDTEKKTILARAEIEALRRTTITTAASDESVTFEGVALTTLLEKAGVEFGESLRGTRMASCLLVEATDGYRAVIALPEIDPAFTDKKIVLAFLRDGKPLDEKEGPYRIVIPDEKRMARWVRQVTTLRIVNVQ